MREDVPKFKQSSHTSNYVIRQSLLCERCLPMGEKSSISDVTIC